MATTRQLVAFVLEQDEELRTWWAEEKGFTIEKAREANLEAYEGYTSAIINEGIRRGIVLEEHLTLNKPI